MTDLSALIAKLEAAMEWDPVLDCDIARAAGWAFTAHADAARARWQAPDGGYHYTPPPFTGSLDVAMRLIPERFYLDLYDWTWAEAGACWSAHLQTANGERYSASAEGPTAALAVCRIAIRARQHLAAQGKAA